MSKPSARERLAEAAFALFDERGYEQATVDDITERAGLGRTTFFRHYRSKDDVIFPDHDRLLEQIAERLRTSSHGTALAAVSDAVRIVLLHYIDEGDLARRRYALTSKVPALRDREITTVARYQRLLREFITAWMADTTEPAPLRAELMAAAVVAAHNHVLRRWLRGDSPDPVRELDAALGQVTGLFAAPVDTVGGAGTTIVAFRSGRDIDALIPALRRLAGEQSPLRLRWVRAGYFNVPECHPDRAQRGGHPGGLLRGHLGQAERCLVQRGRGAARYRAPILGDARQHDAPVVGGEVALDEAAFLQPSDGIGHGRRVHHQADAHLAHGQRAPAAEREELERFVGGERQAVRLERILDPSQQQLLHAHHGRDGGHVIGVLRPARVPLTVCLGDRVEGLCISHAANRT
jgi:AcrR family transcriptional regulator